MTLSHENTCLSHRDLVSLIVPRHSALFISMVSSHASRDGFGACLACKTRNFEIVEDQIVTLKIVRYLMTCSQPYKHNIYV